MRRITRTLPARVSACTFLRSSTYLIIPTKSLEYPFHTKTLSIAARSGESMSSFSRLELFVAMRRMGISGHICFIALAKRRGRSKSMPAMRITRSKLPPRKRSMADSSV